MNNAMKMMTKGMTDYLTKNESMKLYSLIAEVTHKNISSVELSAAIDAINNIDTKYTFPRI